MARRLFFGLWPSERQREALRDPIKAAIGALPGEPVFRGNWHITLKFLGEFPEEHLPALQEAAAYIAVEPFRLRLDRVEFWPRPRIGCLLATRVPAALEALADELTEIVGRYGHQTEERAFRPHITVVRNCKPFAPEPLAQPIMLEWSGFELLESVSSAQGVRYSPLKQGSTDNS